MANSFTTPSTLPDRGDAVAGQYLDADLRAKLGDSLNAGHAIGPCSPMVSQSWGDGQCGWDDASVQDVCVWRLPQPSTAHVTLNVTARTKDALGLGGAVATLRLPHTGDFADFAPVAAVWEWGDKQLNFGTPAVGYGDLHLDLEAPPSEIQVAQISAAFNRLTSPLAPGLSSVGSFEPFGSLSAADDQPADAGTAHQMIEGVGKLLDYPGVISCWSALRGISAYRALAADYMAALPFRQVCLPTRGTIEAGKTYTVWVRTVADQFVDTVVNIHAGPLSRPTVNNHRWGRSAVSITVPAIADAVEANRIAWQTAEFSIPENLWIRDMPWLTAAVGVYPRAGAAATGFTTAKIISLTMWGA